MIKLLLQDPAGAVSDFDAAIRLNPNDGVTYLNRAVALNFQGEYLRAFTDDTKARDPAPNEPLAIVTAAWTCTSLATMPERSPPSSSL